MKGGTRGYFVNTRMVIYFLIYYIIFQIIWFSNFVYGVDTSGWQALGLFFAIAQATFVAAFEAMIMVKKKAFKVRVAFMVI